MLERIITAIVLALVGWLEKKYASSKRPVETDSSPDALSRIGARVRVWENGARARGQSDADGGSSAMPDVRDD